ncbi:hypothetical protein WA158_002886 [Blastocystis sp. Blastoise]
MSGSVASVFKKKGKGKKPLGLKLTIDAVDESNTIATLPKENVNEINSTSSEWIETNKKEEKYVPPELLSALPSDLTDLHNSAKSSVEEQKAKNLIHSVLSKSAKKSEESPKSPEPKVEVPVETKPKAWAPRFMSSSRSEMTNKPQPQKIVDSHDFNAFPTLGAVDESKVEVPAKSVWFSHVNEQKESSETSPSITATEETPKEVSNKESVSEPAESVSEPAESTPSQETPVETEPIPEPSKADMAVFDGLKKKPKKRLLKH